MPTQAPGPTARLALLTLFAPVLLIAVLTTVGPFATDPVALWGGIGVGVRPGWLPGYGTIDPNIGATSFALGVRAALDVLAGKLPLWNHYEGLGAPLLGEMQSAALFPPTLLLALPHGQAIEQALLQAVAGLGTYLFLRRFGLGVGAALAGGLLFEFNGVFAWLRNAVFNPVAFLPWLFYTVESLVGVEREGLGAGRWRWICLGAVTAALALYAGFPEVVYFYSLLVLAWACARGFALPLGRRTVFAGDLVAMALLALVISAPLLTAFADFLPEAAVGGHHGTEFSRAFLPRQAFIVALLPYVFGPIFAAPQASVAAVWGSIGGYLGIMPLLLAVGGTVCGWRRPVTWVLALWVVLAVGASHGVPILHGVLTALPLATTAAYCRYLDAGWLFGCVVLGACFIDQVGAMAPARRRLAGWVAALVCLGLLAVGLGFAATVLEAVWGWRRWPVVLSLGAAAALFTGFLLALRNRRPGTALAGLAVSEAVVWFVVPFASYPRAKHVDRALVEYLRQHVGLQRVAIASGTGLTPNFGSAFGISVINYDDLPAPARTARFVIRKLDETSGGLIFRPDANPSGVERERQRARFVGHLPAYAAAGVRYVLATEAPFAARAAPPGDGPLTPVALRAGQTVTVDLPGHAAARTVRAITVMIGTYDGAADGGLRVRLCQGARCSAGTAPLATAFDKRPLPILLDAPLTLAPASGYRISFAKVGGQHEVALWMQPAPAVEAHVSGIPTPAGSLPIVEEVGAADPVPVLQTATTTVFELGEARPYASAPGCQVHADTRDRIEAHCAAASRLLRLEVFLRGWRARVNGVDALVMPVEDTFQGVDLPAGDSVVAFRYAPAGVPALVPWAAAALLLCLGVLGWGVLGSGVRRTPPGQSTPSG